MDDLAIKGADFLLAAVNLLVALGAVCRVWMPWLCWSGFCFFCIDWQTAYRLIGRQTLLPILLLFGFICTITTYLDHPAHDVHSASIPGMWQLSPWTVSVVQVSLVAGLALFMGTIQLLVAPLRSR